MLEEFRETYFPVLELASWTRRKGGIRVCIPSPNKILVENTIVDKNGVVIGHPVNEYFNSINTSEYTANEIEIIKEHLERASRLVNGCAASYYGVSNIGAALHRSKYENGGDFPAQLHKSVAI